MWILDPVESDNFISIKALVLTNGHSSFSNSSMAFKVRIWMPGQIALRTAAEVSVPAVKPRGNFSENENVVG